MPAAQPVHHQFGTLLVVIDVDVDRHRVIVQISHQVVVVHLLHVHVPAALEVGRRLLYHPGLLVVFKALHEGDFGRQQVVGAQSAGGLLEQHVAVGSELALGEELLRGDYIPSLAKGGELHQVVALEFLQPKAILSYLALDTLSGADQSGVDCHGAQASSHT